MPHSASFRSMQIYIRRRPPNGPPFRLFLSENYGRCFPRPSSMSPSNQPSLPILLFSTKIIVDRICPKWLKKEKIYFLKKIYVARLKRFFLILSLSLSLFLLFLETEKLRKICLL